MVTFAIFSPSTAIHSNDRIVILEFLLLISKFLELANEVKT